MKLWLITEKRQPLGRNFCWVRTGTKKSVEAAFRRDDFNIKALSPTRNALGKIIRDRKGRVACWSLSVSAKICID